MAVPKDYLYSVDRIDMSAKESRKQLGNISCFGRIPVSIDLFLYYLETMQGITDNTEFYIIALGHPRDAV